MSEAGKGDKRIPLSERVTAKEVYSNWDDTFGKKKSKKECNCKDCKCKKGKKDVKKEDIKR